MMPPSGLPRELARAPCSVPPGHNGPVFRAMVMAGSAGVSGTGAETGRVSGRGAGRTGMGA